MAAPAAAATPVPKVALIVGPAGGVTERYRALANDAARAAQAAGAEVVKVYSPNATWPAVKSAVTGASIVVYLGHGNGWPSRYRNSLYPPTQNGFGLNPVAGGDDSTHQYFGEKAVGQLRFASNAVVLLSHLCYASGNTEPGLSEGTADQAVQRVDNYAAGFLRAGARAVVAEAYLGPAYYVKALLRDRGSIEQIWAASPTVNGRHQIAVASVRTPGYAVRLDPGACEQRLRPIAGGEGPHGCRAPRRGRRQTRRRHPGPDDRAIADLDGDPVRRAVVRRSADRGDKDPPHAAARGWQVQADPGRRPGVRALGPDPHGRSTCTGTVRRADAVAHARSPRPSPPRCPNRP